MSETRPRTAVGIRYPFFPVALAVPTVCFIATLLTDLAYWKTAEMMWADFSAWLVTTGVIFGFVALVVWVVDLLRGPFVRAQLPPWPCAIAQVVALALANVNMLVHTHDAWTSVVPWGLVLSAIVAVLVLVAGWMGRTAMYRERIAVQQVGVAP
jgi:uncharacterized membrane protein